MKSAFMYTGIRVRDLDRAIEFFTRVLGMKLAGRVKADWTKGEFANLVSGDGKHWLELNWYPDHGPIEPPFREGEALDHLGFEVADLDVALTLLKKEGFEAKYGPFHGGDWHYAFVPVVDGIWLDLFHRDRKPRKKATPEKKRSARRRRR